MFQFASSQRNIGNSQWNKNQENESFYGSYDPKINLNNQIWKTDNLSRNFENSISISKAVDFKMDEMLKYYESQSFHKLFDLGEFYLNTLVHEIIKHNKLENIFTDSDRNISTLLSKIEKLYNQNKINFSVYYHSLKALENLKEAKLLYKIQEKLDYHSHYVFSEYAYVKYESKNDIGKLADLFIRNLHELTISVK